MRFRWPMPHEIATLYIILLLHRTADHRTLHLPYRASNRMPAEVMSFAESADWRKRIDSNDD